MAIFRMSAISIAIPPQSPITGGPEKVAKELSANARSGYRISKYQETAAPKSLVRENLNARAKVWMLQDLSISSNSEYVYAISQSIYRCYWVKEVGKSPSQEHCL